MFNAKWMNVKKDVFVGEIGIAYLIMGEIHRTALYVPNVHKSFSYFILLLLLVNLPDQKIWLPFLAGSHM